MFQKVESTMRKNFVLDTNILLDNPESLFGFDDNNVWLTGTTLQEIDLKKSKGRGDVQHNARECARILDRLRKEGDLLNGVNLPGGGKLFVEPNGISASNLPAGFSIESPDNRIISTCVYLEKEKHLKAVILVTNDMMMRVNATACKVKVQEHLNDIVQDTGYGGYSSVTCFSKIQGLYSGPVRCPKGLKGDDGDLLHGTGKPFQNEFLTMKYGTASALVFHRNGMLYRIRDTQLCGWITPKNAIQHFMVHALLAPPEEIPLVIFSGPAGTAKTFLSMAVALDQMGLLKDGEDKAYSKLVITRPNVLSDEGFGYWAGDKREKMDPLLAPYYDNIRKILRKSTNEDEKAVDRRIDDMIQDGMLELSPLSHIRGRSISDAYIVCDEAQNASRKLIKDVITRGAEGTKVVLCGDPTQIDAPNLDRYNNGLVYAIESMKTDDTTVVINNIPDNYSLRSVLARAALQRMK